MYSHVLLDQNMCAIEEGDEKEGSDMKNMVGLITYRADSPLDRATSPCARYRFCLMVYMSNSIRRCIVIVGIVPSTHQGTCTLLALFPSLTKKRSNIAEPGRDGMGRVGMENATRHSMTAVSPDC